MFSIRTLGDQCMSLRPLAMAQSLTKLTKLRNNESASGNPNVNASVMCIIEQPFCVLLQNAYLPA
jgi:hypothetical protein